MESISRAVCSLGLVIFSLDRRGGSLIHENGWKADLRRSFHHVETFASVAEDLLETLESLNHSTCNPMDELPEAFECIAEDCATAVEDIRQDMSKTWSYQRSVLSILKLKTWASTIQKYQQLLNPYMESLAGDSHVLESLQNTQPGVINLVSELDTSDTINLAAGVPQHLNTLAEDLIHWKIEFSEPQLYQLLRTLDKFWHNPEALSEASSSDVDDDWSWNDWDDFYEMLDGCRRGLCLISASHRSEEPTPEARNAIIALQKLISDLKDTTKQTAELSGYDGAKRKAEDSEDEDDETGDAAEGSYDQRKKPVSVDLCWIKWVPMKSSPDIYLTEMDKAFSKKVRKENLDSQT
ncbi:hypothetical protein FOMA001_g20150 [Fusarium oxysporum f. sp. matthiolae]|nr:hypothetical protein FOMA001_g20150 [Fusarium oxysporum f. sp. matthiolae]